MAFCERCGQETREGAKFCPGCGAEVGAAPAAPTGAQDEKATSILAYILFFVPMLTGAYKTSDFVRYHTNQGTVLFIAAAACNVAFAVLRGIFVGAFWPAGLYAGRLFGMGVLFGGLFRAVTGLVNLAFLALCVLGIVNAAGGKKTPLPVIGGINVLK
jgi:uncharacterized membrane protein